MIHVNAQTFRATAKAVLAVGLALASGVAAAGPRDQAYRIFNRLNGVPPSPAKLDAMEALVAAGKIREAATAAIDDTNGYFYDIVLKNMVTRWSNADKTPRVPLNDYVATVIGMIRDDVPFDQVLSGDIVYTGNLAGAPAYSLANNLHYEFLEAQGAKLHTVLTKQTQSAVAGLPAEATAGALSTRGFADAYYKAGTNRRAVAFTLGTFLCKELEQLMDTTRPDFRVRKDVTRAPGGDSSLFRNRCAGCHAGMDAFAGAFAHYDVSDAGAFVYTPGVVSPKYNRNTTEFPDGFETTDDSWLNMWTEGQNATVGWGPETAGNGAKSFGQMIAATEAFSQCMAKRAFETVCLHAPTGDAELDAVDALAKDFVQGGHNMKGLFAGAATTCLE